MKSINALSNVEILRNFLAKSSTTDVNYSELSKADKVSYFESVAESIPDVIENETEAKYSSLSARDQLDYLNSHMETALYVMQHPDTLIKRVRNQSYKNSSLESKLNYYTKNVEIPAKVTFQVFGGSNFESFLNIINSLTPWELSEFIGSVKKEIHDAETLRLERTAKAEKDTPAETEE